MVGQKYEAGGIAATAPAGDRGGLRAGAEVHRAASAAASGAGNYGMRTRLRPALPVDVAEREDRRGWAANRPPGCSPRSSCEQAERAGQQLGVEEEAKIKAPILEQYEHQGHPYYPARDCGTTA